VRRAAGLGGLIVTLALVVPPVGGRAADSPSSVTVSMKSFAFSPVSVAVAQGGTVTWTYDETATDLGCESPVFQTPLPVNCPGHSTTAVDKGTDGKVLWDSGVHRAEGFPFKVTFPKAGTYHYICTVHGGAAANNPVTMMEGDVVVFAPTTAPTSAPAPQVQAATGSRDTLAVTGGSLAWAIWGVLAAATALGMLALRRRVGRLTA
jgi:plastocyanin